MKCRDLMQRNFFSSFVGNAIVASTIPCYLSRLAEAEKIRENTDVPLLPELRFVTDHRREGAKLGPAVVPVLEV